MKTKIDKACKILRKKIGYDKVLDAFTSPDYVQITVSTGGDVSTFRVYSENKIYEK